MCHHIPYCGLKSRRSKSLDGILVCKSVFRNPVLGFDLCYLSYSWYEHDRDRQPISLWVNLAHIPLCLRDIKKNSRQFHHWHPFPPVPRITPSIAVAEFLTLNLGRSPGLLDSHAWRSSSVSTATVACAAALTGLRRLSTALPQITK